MDDQDKLYARFAKLMDDQTNEPTKKEVAAVVTKFYTQLKKDKKANGAAAVDEHKPKRAPTAYNIFFKEQMAILKDKEKDLSKDECMTAKAKMAHVAELWKAKKEEHFEEAPEEPEVEEAEEEVEEVEEEAKPEPEPVKPEVKNEPKAKFGGGGGKGGGGGSKFGKGGK